MGEPYKLTLAGHEIAAAAAAAAVAEVVTGQKGICKFFQFRWANFKRPPYRRKRKCSVGKPQAFV